jgi:pentatricopeptide repeat protein
VLCKHKSNLVLVVVWLTSHCLFCHTLRSASRYLLHEAWTILTNPVPGEVPGIAPTLDACNIVLSGYAERGDVKHTMFVFHSFAQFGLEPNSDSYSFAMEVLGKDIHRRIREDRNKDRDNSVGQGLVDRNIDSADEILTMMERNGIPPSADVIRNYVELLCLAGEVATATGVVKDLLASDETKSAVNNKSIYRVAIANADVGDFELAWQLAAATSEYIPMLHRIIDSKEQRYRNLESIKLRRLGQMGNDAPLVKRRDRPVETTEISS